MSSFGLKKQKTFSDILTWLLHYICIFFHFCIVGDGIQTRLQGHCLLYTEKLQSPFVFVFANYLEPTCHPNDYTWHLLYSIILYWMEYSTKMANRHLSPNIKGRVKAGTHGLNVNRNWLTIGQCVQQPVQQKTA